MTDMTPRRPFQPGRPDAAGVVTWIHIGDLHMTEAGEQNHLDLVAIVDEINRVFAGSVAFVYIPGDVAEHGSAAEYDIVRAALQPLQVPWCSIVGDHDVHEKAFTNYLNFSQQDTHYSFAVGSVRFIALNAFDTPHPASFCLLPGQLKWLETQAQEVVTQGGSAVLLLHCYPTDLKQGTERLRTVVESPAVRLIDMGHTHYNELANDGKTLYTATRSTGQIEEGPVGFSITNIDGAVISWKFVEAGKLPIVMITSPADERFITDSAVKGHVAVGIVHIRAKAWSTSAIRTATARLNELSVALTHIQQSNVWEGELEAGDLPNGTYALSVSVEDIAGNTAEDCIRIVVGAQGHTASKRAERDQENAVDAWPEHGLLGTQLGPNKNGRKW